MTLPRLIVGLAAALAAHLAMATPGAAAATDETKAAGGSGQGRTRHVLALTWQPGFCRTRPDSPECASHPANGPAAARLTLHGLWQVKKSYCGIGADQKRQDRQRRWTELPALALSAETTARLAIAMPGVASGLDRHQWLMNGTCHAASAEAYYRRALAMLEAVERSAVGAYLAGQAGSTVTQAGVAAAFEAAFGEGAGERVRLRCRTVGGEAVVTGLTVGLAADEGDLAALVRGAAPTTSRCERGLLERAVVAD